MQYFSEDYDLVFTPKTFGLLRTVLINHLGINKAKQFLLQFGKELGSEKAKDIISNTTDIESFIKRVSEIHVSLGHISKMTTLGTILYNNKGNYFNNVKGIWYDSFEVPLQVNNFGQAAECTCFILSGFASGILSTFHNKDIFVKEITCRAKGDEHCTFEVNTKEYWEEKNNEQLAIYDSQTIQNELEYTYEKLLEQKILLKKVTEFHSKITEIVAQQNDLTILLQTAYELLGIPSFITDFEGKIQYQITHLSIDQTVFSSKIRKKLSTLTRTTTFYLGNKALLVTPILLDNKVFAFCLFLYDKPEQIDENDYLYLERLAVAASLCFLNEKVSFEATERLKINFLDRLIHHPFKNIEELHRYSNFITPKIKPPFYIVSAKFIIQNNIYFLPNTYEIILRIAKMLNYYNVIGLISQKEDHIIIFIYDLNDINRLINVLKLIFKEIKTSDLQLHMKAGVSKAFNNIDDFYSSLTEAEKAMNFPKYDNIIKYEDLGVFVALLENLNPDTLISLAKNELGPLLNQDENNKELLYTLYIFLKNQQKLDKTMRELSLSIGGIRYRISKIEKILHKDLKDATTAAHLLLMIETLILINYISFDHLLS